MRNKTNALPADTPYLADLYKDGDARKDIAHVLPDGRRLRLMNVTPFAFGEKGCDEFIARKLNGWVETMIEGGTPAFLANNREAHDDTGGGDCLVIDIIDGTDHEFILTCAAF